MRLLQLVLVCALAASTTVGAVEKLRFDNHRVYNIDIQNAEQLKTLQQLELNSDGVSWGIPFSCGMLNLINNWICIILAPFLGVTS